MRIMIVYPGTQHSTYDVARGYEKALRQLGHTVKSFDYHHYIKFYSVALDEWEQRNENYERRIDDAVKFSSERVAIEAVDFVPDVVLVVAGGAFHHRGYMLLYRLNVPIVLLLTESPYIDDVQSRIVNQGRVSLVLTNDRNSISTLLDLTGVETRYIPHSFDPDTHHPGKSKLQTDVFFHGTLWDERDALFSPLRDLDEYDIHISGYTLQDTVETQRKNLVDNDIVADYYRGCKIAINHHRTSRENGERHIGANEAYSLGPRAYEIAACGAFQLCDGTRPELFDVFRGSVPIYEGPQDLQEQIEFYLRDDTLRQSYAARAREYVQNCTFTDRAQNIVIPALQEVLNGRW